MVSLPHHESEVVDDQTAWLDVAEQQGRRQKRAWRKVAAASSIILAIVIAAPATAADEPNPEKTVVECDDSVYLETVTVVWRDSATSYFSSVQVDPTPLLQRQVVGGHGQLVDEFVACLALTAGEGRTLLVQTTITVTLQPISPCWIFCVYGSSEEEFAVPKKISPDDSVEVRRSTLIDQLLCHDALPGFIEERTSQQVQEDDRWDLEGHRPPSDNLLFDWIFRACNW